MKIPVITLMTVPDHVLMTIPADLMMIIPAKVLMMIYNKLKLVTCNYLQSVRNTMLNKYNNTLRKTVYRPTYVPYNQDGQKLLLPQTTDMSRKDNPKLLYSSLPEGMCDNEYESLKEPVNDVETFQYSHETSTKHVLVQGVYVGSASPLIADVKNTTLFHAHIPGRWYDDWNI